MEVKKVTENKKRFLDLLLLADEQESMVDAYLERGDLFALYDKQILRGICVVTDEGGRVREIKNIATYEQYHGMGYGRTLIEHVLRYYKDVCDEMIVGTGDSPSTIPFYERMGFKRYRTVKNFFTDH